jgi:hypothetical protein
MEHLQQPDTEDSSGGAGNTDNEARGFCLLHAPSF